MYITLWHNPRCSRGRQWLRQRDCWRRVTLAYSTYYFNLEEKAFVLCLSRWVNGQQSLNSAMSVCYRWHTWWHAKASFLCTCCITPEIDIEKLVRFAHLAMPTMCLGISLVGPLPSLWSIWVNDFVFMELNGTFRSIFSLVSSNRLIEVLLSLYQDT